MSGKRSKLTRAVTNKEGRTGISTESEQRARWAEHFHDLLNRPPPSVMPDINETEGPLLSKAEIVRALKQLKNGRAAGPDGIPPEVLKINPITTAEMLHPLFLKIWEVERVPSEWKHGYLVKLPKKGDLGLCNNWRGIMLFSIPSKVFYRIIFERLKDALDKQLRCNQAGFRKDRSCTNHIATSRIIIEQSKEWQTPLYLNFIDFEKAFDSVDRNVIWQLMHHYGIPPKFIKLIQDLYESSSCQVIRNEKLSDSF